MIICFIGIDGSGKTTYALKLYQELKEEGFKCEYIHFDSLFAHRLLNIVKIASLTTTKIKYIYPKDSSKKGILFLISIIKGTTWSLILIIDNIFFYLLKLLKSKKKEEVVICDRYFYDSAISSIYSGAKEYFIYRIYQWIFPSPDIMFLIDVDAQTAYSRKQEESLEYLACKRELYLKLYSIMQCKKIKINSSIYFNKSFAVIRDNVHKLLEVPNE